LFAECRSTLVLNLAMAGCLCKDEIPLTIRSSVPYTEHKRKACKCACVNASDLDLQPRCYTCFPMVYRWQTQSFLVPLASCLRRILVREHCGRTWSSSVEQARAQTWRRGLKAAQKTRSTTQREGCQVGARSAVAQTLNGGERVPLLTQLVTRLRKGIAGHLQRNHTRVKSHKSPRNTPTQAPPQQQVHAVVFMDCAQTHNERVRG